MLKTMERAAKLLFRSLSSVYDGTISRSALNPNIYFIKNNGAALFYGIRLHDLMPTRLIAKIYQEGKNIILDLLWLVDNKNSLSANYFYIRKERNKIHLVANSAKFKEIVENDATIRACYDDFVSDINAFDVLLIGSKHYYFMDVAAHFNLNVSNLPTQLFAISRCKINSKKLTNINYTDKVLNCLLAVIDTVHKGLELIENQSDKKQFISDHSFCVRCGYELPSDSIFCPFCGAKQPK